MVSKVGVLPLFGSFVLRIIRLEKAAPKVVPSITIVREDGIPSLSLVDGNVLCKQGEIVLRLDMGSDYDTNGGYLQRGAP